MKTFELTDDALRNINNMRKRVAEVADAFGPAWFSREAQEIEESFMNVLYNLFLWPGSVHAEDDLSLIINSSITIGVIWHPVRIKGEDGKMERHELLGSWSLHS